MIERLEQIRRRHEPAQHRHLLMRRARKGISQEPHRISQRLRRRLEPNHPAPPPPRSRLSAEEGSRLKPRVTCRHLNTRQTVQIDSPHRRNQAIPRGLRQSANRTVLEGYGGAAVQHEFGRYGDQFGPYPPLRRRKNIKAWRERVHDLFLPEALRVSKQSRVEGPKNQDTTPPRRAPHAPAAPRHTSTNAPPPATPHPPAN